MVFLHRSNDARSGADGNILQRRGRAESRDPMTPAAERMGTFIRHSITRRRIQ